MYVLCTHIIIYVYVYVVYSCVQCMYMYACTYTCMCTCMHVYLINQQIHTFPYIYMFFLTQTFLAIQLNGKLPDNLKEEPRPLPPISKPSLGPSPLPISSTQLSSPLHSIPSLPPPTNQPIVGVVSTGPPVWDHKVTKSEWHALLQNDSENLSSLKRFLGSLSLLVHWVKEASSDRYLQQQVITCVRLYYRLITVEPLYKGHLGTTL